MDLLMICVNKARLVKLQDFKITLLNARAGEAIVT